MESSIIPRYTYSDYAQWKEDWELIKGYPYQLLPSAKWRHNNAQLNIVTQFKVQLKNGNCNCTVFSELDWKINEETVVRPDVMIVCGEIETDYLEFPPVLIVEVISQGSLFKDRNIKFDLYRENGVRYYLLCDYIKKTVEIFELIDNVYRSTSRNGFELMDDCAVELNCSEIFA
jgi:Uma2 family endonuclease